MSGGEAPLEDLGDPVPLISYTCNLFRDGGALPAPAASRVLAGLGRGEEVLMHLAVSAKLLPEFPVALNSPRSLLTVSVTKYR